MRLHEIETEAAALRAALAEEAWHPAPEEIARFARASVAPADREAIESHLDFCARCAEDAGDLRAMLAPPPRRRWRAPFWTAIAASAMLVFSWTATRPAANISAPPRVDDAAVPATIAMPEILRTLRPAASSLRSAAPRSRAAAMQPMGAVIESDMPRFSWSGVPGTTAYHVLVVSNGVEAARSGALPATSWQVPFALPRGAIYEWQVIAESPRGDVVLPPPDAPPALFGILSAAAAEEIAADANGDPLRAGLLYARAGVVDRAEETLRAYAAAHPESARAAALHRTVERWRSW